MPQKNREEVPLKSRRNESARLRIKYPDRIPIICEISKGSETTIQLDRHKYLVPYDLTIGQLLIILKKRNQLDASQSLYLFTEDTTLSPCSELISSLYKIHKNEDGFLYLIVAVEMSFG